MRIVLSSLCRGHMFALASYLAKTGHLKMLYCAYPHFKTMENDIPQESIMHFPWVHTPYMALSRFGLMPDWAERIWSRADRKYYGDFVARNLIDTDVFHGLSCHNLKPGLLAQRRGARYVCDRGSSHVVFHNNIMREEGERMGVQVKPLDPTVIEIELAEYEACDRIFVPSLFARRTFLEAGFADSKVWSLPYGVDLSRWRQVPVVADGKFRVIFLGTLSLRKGIHDLLAGFAAAGLPNSELVLIGANTSMTERLLAPYRSLSNVIRTGTLPHAKVLEWFSRGSVFVLPSIEDGFGLVLMEAQACGLPVIATCNTGGPDVVDPKMCNGFVVPIRAPTAIAERLTYLYANPEHLRAMRATSLERASQMQGWGAFGHGMIQLYRTLGES